MMKWKRAVSGLLAAVMMIGMASAAGVNGNSGGPEPMTQEKVNAANEAYNEENAVLQIISMSDTHVAS